MVQSDDINRIISECATRYPQSIDTAVEHAAARVAKLPEYPTLVADLVTTAIRGLIQDYRHTENTRTRAAAGEYGGPAKVTAGDAAGRVALGVYSYYIAGRTLGLILGKELSDIAQSEAARAEGHQFNAALCERLRPLVKDDQTVKQAVTETKLRKLFADLQGTRPTEPVGLSSTTSKRATKTANGVTAV